MVFQRNDFLKIGAVAAIVIVVTTYFSYQVLSERGLYLPGTAPKACTMEAQICPDGTAVGRTGPNCEFAPCLDANVNIAPQSGTQCTPANLVIQQPTPGTHVTFPITLTGVVDNRTKKDCTWVLFEGQAGTIEVRDAQGNLVGQGILGALGDWMADAPVKVEGTVELLKPPTGPAMTVTITEENPSGVGVGQQLKFNLTY